MKKKFNPFEKSDNYERGDSEVCDVVIDGEKETVVASSKLVQIKLQLQKRSESAKDRKMAKKADLQNSDEQPTFTM